MKILHINRNYNSSALHQAMLAHMETYEDLNNSVFVPVEPSEPDRTNHLTHTEVYVSPCLSRWDRYIYCWKQHKIRRSLEQNFDVHQFDCIHAYTLFTDGNCAMKLSETYNIPYVVAVRSTDLYAFFERQPYLRSRGISIMEHAAAIFFLSESYRDQVFSKYVPEELNEKLMAKAHIIPNGIDDFWLEHCYTEKRELHNPVRLIYAGKIMARKNIEVAVAAVEELSRQGVNAELTVVGEVQDQKIYDRILQHDFVHYHEAVPKEKLINFYRESDIFVMPSYKETFGLVYAEAMSQGLPVIYTKGEGFDGQFPEGKVGYHVDAHNPAGVASAISNIFVRYQTISSAVSEESMIFNWSGIVSQYQRIYDRIIRNR